RRTPKHWLTLHGVQRNNLRGIDAAFPIGCLTCVTGVSGSGKSSLVSQVLLELVSAHLGQQAPAAEEEGAAGRPPDAAGDDDPGAASGQGASAPRGTLG